MPKALSKTQKRLDNSICKVLNALCEQKLKSIDGFEWLTHQANYSNFPASLIITCVFSDKAHEQLVVESQVAADIRQDVQKTLFKIGVKIPAPKFQIRWDNEESCTTQNNGNWQERLASRAGLAVSRNRP